MALALLMGPVLAALSLFDEKMSRSLRRVVPFLYIGIALNLLIVGLAFLQGWLDQGVFTVELVNLAGGIYAALRLNVERSGPDRRGVETIIHWE